MQVVHLRVVVKRETHAKAAAKEVGNRQEDRGGLPRVMLRVQLIFGRRGLVYVISGLQLEMLFAGWFTKAYNKRQNACFSVMRLDQRNLSII